MAHKEAGYTTVTSHRSGETADTTIASVSCSIKYAKSKQVLQVDLKEDLQKYNQLLELKEVGEYVYTVSSIQYRLIIKIQSKGCIFLYII